MNNGIFCYLQLRFPEKKLEEWKKAEIQWDEYEWDEDIEYMISDMELSTVEDFLKEMEKVGKGKKKFFAVDYSSDKKELTLKGYFDFDTMSEYMVGWLTMFRKAAEFGADGKAAYISDSGLLDDFIMYAFEIRKGKFKSYICPNYPGAEYDEPDNPVIKKFSTIWSDDIGKEIEKRMAK